MHKRVGNLEINRSLMSEWTTVTYHCNASVQEDITLRSIDDVRDLHYAIGELLREMNAETVTASNEK